ncbi:efflux RND transporter periplasmic adaptor subunit [Pseudomonas sp. KFB-139]|uniref:Efflux RND transporter periplasmic adaptor subunit n=1 Tax=Pseudomonas serbiensis TaxID=3064350 RepID=A0ABT9D037_9PSED|nr:efflux RND transporter periplasmic adaptor subunit [Pseudomonas sp. KFB-138]MDO7929916.1 efflux RND transporter periplasmic adaptor subunit [Pseudomonas sp. KFB-138]
MRIWRFLRGLNYRKIILRVIFIDLLVSLAGYALYKGATQSDTPNYLTASAEITSIEHAVLADGVLHGQQQVDVGAQVSGQLQTLKVAPGDNVHKDQLLAQIDPLPARNALRQAIVNSERLTADRDAAAHQLKLARLTYQRYEELGADAAVSREDFDKAKYDYEELSATLASLEAQVRTARIKIETARINLGYTRILAPMDGKILAIVTQEGQTVIAEQLAPVILKMAQLDTMTIKARVSEADVVKIKVGMPVYFTILGDRDKRYNATLRGIEPASTSFASQSGGAGRSDSAVFYNALFDVPNPDGRLRINMTAQVRVVLEVGEGVLTIPVAALGEQNPDGTFPVSILEEKDQVRAENIRTGINNKVRVQVLSGLKAGDKVVIGGEVAK